MKDIEKYIINENTSIYEAYYKYKHNKLKILMVVDKNNDFCGVITAKELHKKNVKPSDSVALIVNKNCKYVQYSGNKKVMNADLNNIYSKSKKISCIPIVNNKKVVDLHKRKIKKSVEVPKAVKIKNEFIQELRGNYSPFIKNVVNEYLRATYNMTIESLDDFVTKYLIDERKVYETKIDGIKFYFEDSAISLTVPAVSWEINFAKEYNYKEIDFKKGDIVVDIGGNVGIVSIYLAKKFPFLKIYAYEPVVQNYESFLRNIKLNKIPEGVITVENKAVTSDGRNVCMALPRTNSGGSTLSDINSNGLVVKKENSNIKSTTLDQIFKEHDINELRLLKIDCEGSEYEILQNADKKLLKRIKSLRGEFHDNKELTNFNIDDLYEYTSSYIKDTVVCKASGVFKE